MTEKNAGGQIDDLAAQKKEIISAISHAVRTPLSIIKEGLCLLQDEIPGMLNPKQKRIIKVVKANIDRLTGTVNEILQSTRTGGKLNKPGKISEGKKE